MSSIFLACGSMLMLPAQDDYQNIPPDDQDTEFFDVKFYPYGDDSHDPIFAAVSKRHVGLVGTPFN